MEQIEASMDFECNQSYLMYKNKNGHIYGLWFFEADELSAVVEKIRM